jgi:WD40 repeat protein
LLSSEQRFLTADIAGYLYKWSYTSKQPLVKFKAHENCINAVTLLKDFRIATCCQDGLLKLWSGSMLGNKPLQVFEHKYPLWSLCATKRYLLSGDVEGFISYHCPDTLVIKKTIKAHSSGIFMLRECQMAIDKGYMSCGEDFKAKLWSV